MNNGEEIMIRLNLCKKTMTNCLDIMLNYEHRIIPLFSRNLSDELEKSLLLLLLLFTAPYRMF